MNTAGNVMIPRKYTPSNQDVQIALVLNKSSEDDPFNAWSLATSEVLSPDSGAVVWYLATGKQQSDTFFAHGGFFSPLRPLQTFDAAVSVIPPSSARVGVSTSYTVSVNLLPGGTGTYDGTVSVSLPASATYQGSSPTGCQYAEPHHIVECNVSLTTASPSTTVSLVVVHSTALTFSGSAILHSIDLDNALANNKANYTVTIAP